MPFACRSLSLHIILKFRIWSSTQIHVHSKKRQYLNSSEKSKKQKNEYANIGKNKRGEEEMRKIKMPLEPQNKQTLD